MTVPNAADAIGSAFISPNETDQNMEPANVVDGLFAIARSLNRLSDVIELDSNNRTRGFHCTDCCQERKSYHDPNIF